MEIQFSKNLRKYLELNNLSLTEFSGMLKVPTSTAHGWVNGIPPRNIIILKKIADFLGVSLDELCFEKKESGFEKIKNLESHIIVEHEKEKYKVVLLKV